MTLRVCAADKAYRTGGGGLQGPLAGSCKRHKVHHDKTEDTLLHGMSLEPCLPQSSNYKYSQLKIGAFSVATSWCGLLSGVLESTDDSSCMCCVHVSACGGTLQFLSRKIKVTQTFDPGI